MEELLGELIDRLDSGDMGSFTPVVIQIIIVAGNLLAYNRSIAWSNRRA
jgi:hypothetical protein